MDTELNELREFKAQAEEETLSFPIVERMLDDLKEMKEELDYTKGFIKPYYEKLIESRDDEGKTMEIFMKYRDDPDINLEYDYDWDPASVGWESNYEFDYTPHPANGQYTITMAGGGSRWWNYVIRNMGTEVDGPQTSRDEGTYVIYVENQFGLHLQEGRLLVANGDDCQYFNFFDDEPKAGLHGDLVGDFDYADYWLKDFSAKDICDVIDGSLDIWDGEDPEDMGR